RIHVAPNAVRILADDRLAARLPQAVARGGVGDVLFSRRRRDLDDVRGGELAADLDAGVVAVACARTLAVAIARTAAVSAARAGFGLAGGAAAVRVGEIRDDASAETEWPVVPEAAGPDAFGPEAVRSGVAVSGAGEVAVAAAVLISVSVAIGEVVAFAGSM